MALEVWSHDIRTGAPLLRVAASSATGSPTITGDGSGTVTVPLREKKYTATEAAAARAINRNIFRVNDRIVTLRDGEHIPYAGFIEGTSYDFSTGVLTLRLKEIRQILRQRLTFPVDQPELGNMTIAGKSWEGTVRAIIQRAMWWSTQWVLPIDVPVDSSGTVNLTWRAYQELTINDLLAQIESWGAVIMFRPYLTTAGGVRFGTEVFSV